MKKYLVHGRVTLNVTMEVETESAESAVDEAYDLWPGLTGYVGNGATSGKLIGTNDHRVTIEPLDPGEVEFYDTEERK